MSLKAKIEAVIYASEEPVTLPQLASLLGLEAQEQLNSLAAQQPLALSTGEAVPDQPESNPDPQEPTTAQREPTTAQRESNADPQGPTIDRSQPVQSSPETTADKREARERERRVRDHLGGIVQELIAEYANGDRGIEVREVAGGYRMGTKPEYHDSVRGFARSLKPPLKLTLQSLETLAVVAYKQPITAPEVSEIRGVDSGGVLGSLLARKLIATAGRKQVIGRPILYKTTKDFLLRFGLKDIQELPSIEEFERLAGELTEQEEMAMESSRERAEERITHENLVAEEHVTEPQADGDSDSLEENESNLSSDDLPAVDGRMSGLPPAAESETDDPSAEDAAIQSGNGD